MAVVAFNVLALAAPSSAADTPNGACTMGLTLAVGSTQFACYGRHDGNVLNNSSNSTINAALLALGYTGPAVTFDLVPATQKLSGLGGIKDVNFPGL